MEALEAAISALSVEIPVASSSTAATVHLSILYDTRCRSVIIYTNSIGRILVLSSTQ